jgi:hypothetical protein
VAQEERVSGRKPFWYRSNHLRISDHALQRAYERYSEYFAGISVEQVAKRCAGAIYNATKSEVRVLPNSMGRTSPEKERLVRQVGIPFVFQGDTEGTILGWLILAPDAKYPGDTICKTFLSPDDRQFQYEFIAELPLWYQSFRKKTADA